MELYSLHQYTYQCVSLKILVTYEHKAKTNAKDLKNLST